MYGKDKVLNGQNVPIVDFNDLKTHQFLKTQDRFPAAKAVLEVVSATFLPDILQQSTMVCLMSSVTITCTYVQLPVSLQ